MMRLTATVGTVKISKLVAGDPSPAMWAWMVDGMISQMNLATGLPLNATAPGMLMQEGETVDGSAVGLFRVLLGGPLNTGILVDISMRLERDLTMN